ncbi:MULTISPECIES: ribosome hibernation-promoting factor, HPF/YfiA family [Reichenbachiella]|uniref:Putative sigma-54 modulation protein n=1 Tax=Reichenbachiella agariperforans TaxID=156994 RepID=A0A1M6Q9G5_REIAG|nr:MULTISPECIES: ribosome-associated translation inhibitor RaiA [Reichenbachiella]MBU2914274.1 ribosome-associated translation inhibitor RaiA [Reichenbachiella agariperforans]RJE73001.1 ribosomal subunit interface protein [Reichenbachiella sp. MSK19-1]SHK16727.1 putative sigma-54 modulation protein [Reichenbachiella agariperforans]
MKLQMHSIHFDADQKLVNFIQKKADKLETFYDRIIDGEVIMKVENADSRDNKTIEIKVNIPGTQLFAKRQSKSFEAGTDEVIESLRRQLKKRKEKMAAH